MKILYILELPARCGWISMYVPFSGSAWAMACEKIPVRNYDYDERAPLLVCLMVRSEGLRLGCTTASRPSRSTFLIEAHDGSSSRPSDLGGYPNQRPCARCGRSQGEGRIAQARVGVKCEQPVETHPSPWT